VDIGAAIGAAAVGSGITVAEGTEDIAADGAALSTEVLGIEAEAGEVVKRRRLFREYKAVVGRGSGSEHLRRDDSTMQTAMLILSSCCFLDEALNL
jgi:hypothetical protein